MKKYIPLLMLPLSFLGIIEATKRSTGIHETPGIEEQKRMKEEENLDMKKIPRDKDTLKWDIQHYINENKVLLDEIKKEMRVTPEIMDEIKRDVKTEGWEVKYAVEYIKKQYIEYLIPRWSKTEEIEKKRGRAFFSKNVLPDLFKLEDKEILNCLDRWLKKINEEDQKKFEEEEKQKKQEGEWREIEKGWRRTEKEEQRIETLKKNEIEKQKKEELEKTSGASVTEQKKMKEEKKKEEKLVITEKIIKYLKENPGSHSAKEIAVKIDGNYGSVRVNVNNLVKKGLVKGNRVDGFVLTPGISGKSISGVEDGA
ncbi:MAG: winged helix-turn-helix transcriptional regulator [Candidatus Thermoplasmatota archaeon]|nr:winged helix-turn-helix transcriptional regulator [Candidatus Thermoplasmatota archaeon]MCG2825672.1 winged helix-turn-helix transcriptional regulator [Thermoplasmatales archaeon]